MTKHRKPDSTQDAGARHAPGPAISQEEEALLARIEVENDPDDLFPTDEEIATARPLMEADPELAACIIGGDPALEAEARVAAEAFHRRRGRPRVANPRVQVSLRLDPDVLEKFRSTGPGWQGRINEALRKARV